MSKINSMQNLLSMFNDMRMKGPVLEGQMFDPQVNAQMDTVEFSVSNHSKIPVLPFGVFGEIVNERNGNNAWVKLRVHPSYWLAEDEELAVFELWEESQVKPSEYIASALVENEVVAMPADGLSENDVWESTVTAIDNVHGIRKTVRVVSGVDQYDENETYDEELGVHVRRHIKLVNVYAAPTTTYAANVITYMHCVSLKSGWWLEIKETFAAVGGVLTYSYFSVVDYHFPPVLSSIDTYIWETIDGAPRYFPQEVWTKGAYSGPCNATVAVSWGLAAPAAVALTQMQPTAVMYNCPFFQINTGPCLHGEVILHANIGSSDPDWGLNADSEFTNPATNYTAWPATLVVDAPVRMYKGGYLQKVVTINKPT